MTPTDRRVPHVLPRRELAGLLAPTYAAALAVDEEVARERLERALADPSRLGGLHAAIATALDEARGPRTDAELQVDRISKALEARRARVRAAPSTPAVSAAMVWLNLAIGLAPASMEETLAAGKGAALLAAGLREVAASLVKDLSRGAGRGSPTRP